MQMSSFRFPISLYLIYNDDDDSLSSSSSSSRMIWIDTTIAGKKVAVVVGVRWVFESLSITPPRFFMNSRKHLIIQPSRVICHERVTLVGYKLPASANSTAFQVPRERERSFTWLPYVMRYVATFNWSVPPWSIMCTLHHLHNSSIKLLLCSSRSPEKNNNYIPSWGVILIFNGSQKKKHWAVKGVEKIFNMGI